MKKIAIFLAALVAVATQANVAIAQFAPPSGGEVAAFLKCFYECKPGPNVQGVATYQEITTLMLTNQSPDPRVADVFYFDGQEQCVAHSKIELSSVDLDELSVCHSLGLPGVVVPPAGLVEILVTNPIVGGPGDGVYAWGKNVLGKFRVDNPEPFEGRVTGIGKYECRLVPVEVRAEEAVRNKCFDAAGVPTFEEVTPLLVERTEDQPPDPVPCGLENFPICNGICPVGTTCQEDPFDPTCICQDDATPGGPSSQGSR